MEHTRICINGSKNARLECFSIIYTSRTLRQVPRPTPLSQGCRQHHHAAQPQKWTEKGKKSRVPLQSGPEFFHPLTPPNLPLRNPRTQRPQRQQVPCNSPPVYPRILQAFPF